MEESYLNGELEVCGQKLKRTEEDSPVLGTNKSQSRERGDLIPSQMPLRRMSGVLGQTSSTILMLDKQVTAL
jgi:hypothetical protein